MSVKIGVLFNCQGNVIAHAMRAVSPAADVVYVSIADVAQSEEKRREAKEILATRNHIVTMDAAVGNENIPLAWLRATGAAVLRLPTIRFRGFHPDSVIVLRKGQRKLLGPTAGYHSRIAIAAFLSGLSVQETLELYNALVFARLGYFGEYARQFELMKGSFEGCGLDFAPMESKLRRAGCFMHSINHPKVLPLLELAIAICRRIGLPIENENVQPDDLPDLLDPAPIHPVFPEIAARLGIEAEGAYRPNIPPGSEYIEFSHEQFIARCFRLFAATDRETLLAVDGVAQAIGSLGLGRG
jgi:hypothetical protein